MTAHPALVAKVSTAIQQADKGPLEVPYDTLAAAAVDAVIDWIQGAVTQSGGQR